MCAESPFRSIPPLEGCAASPQGSGADTTPQDGDSLVSESLASDSPTPEPLAPGLYVVATPIGNLRDITLRARDVLAGADLILCEDTRVTAKLLRACAVDTPMRSYHDHNAEARRPEILQRLADGARIALVSDAGTPLLADPGYKLVRAVRAAGVPVTPVPGPSAVLAALMGAGLPTDRFVFEGFLPSKRGARRAVLEELAGLAATLAFYESPRRLRASLADMAAVLGAREAVVARELTKRFETFVAGPLDDLAGRFEAPPKGEVVVLVAPPAAPAAADEAEIDARLRVHLADSSPRDAVAAVVRETGAPRKTVYARAIALKDTA